MPPRPARRDLWFIDREELAWAAGFVDGEGSFYKQKTASRKKPNKPWRPRFEIGQVDSYALYRLQAVLPFGNVVNGPYDNKKHATARARPVYCYCVSGFEDVQALVALLWTWLGPVKRSQAASLLKEYLNGS